MNPTCNDRFYTCNSVCPVPNENNTGELNQSAYQGSNIQIKDVTIEVLFSKVHIIKTVVENNGNSDVGPFYVKSILYAGQSNTSTNKSEIVQFIPGLAWEDGQDEIIITHYINGVSGGKYLHEVLADASYLISESDELDNFKSTWLTFGKYQYCRNDKCQIPVYNSEVKTAVNKWQENEIVMDNLMQHLKMCLHEKSC